MVVNSQPLRAESILGYVPSGASSVEKKCDLKDDSSFEGEVEEENDFVDLSSAVEEHESYEIVYAARFENEPCGVHPTSKEADRDAMRREEQEDIEEHYMRVYMRVKPPL